MPHERERAPQPASRKRPNAGDTCNPIVSRSFRVFIALVGALIVLVAATMLPMNALGTLIVLLAACGGATIGIALIGW